MLEKILIEEFQAHKRLQVDFAPGVTAILGPSDVGKSAVIRSLRWAATNQPAGDSFIRHGSKGATVTLTVDGKQIKRQRLAGGDNTYELDGRIYRAFGAEPPQAVADLLNIGPVNFQCQFDSPWWFSSTAGEVSRQLNAVVDLGIIDQAQAAAVSAQQKARDAAIDVAAKVTQARKDKEALEWVPAAQEAYDGVAAASDIAAGVAGLHNLLSARIDEIGRLTTKHETLAAAADACLAAAKAGRAAYTLAQRRDAIMGLVATARKAAAVVAPPASALEAIAAAGKMAVGWAKRRAGLRMLRDQIEGYEEAMVFGPSEAAVAELGVARDGVIAAADRRRVLARLIDETRAKTGASIDADQAHKAAADNLAKWAGGHCPICGNVLVAK